MLRDEHRLPGATFAWDGRNRRPPLDAVNCLLSYAYSLLVKDLTVVCVAVGLDPYLGFYHRPRFGRPALALDLAEEFRPLIAESMVIGVINNREVAPHDFVVRAGGVALTRDGRKAVLAATSADWRSRFGTPSSVTGSVIDDSSTSRSGCSRPTCWLRYRSIPPSELAEQ